MVLALVMCGYTMVAQNMLKDVPHEEDPPLAIEKIDTNFDEMKIFTANGELNVSYEYPEMGTVKVQLFDITGREILNESKEKSSTKFEFKQDVSSLPASIYVVRIYQDKKKITRKLYI